MEKRIIILGGGESGCGAAILANKLGFDVFLSDFGSIADKYKEMLDSRAVYPADFIAEAKIDVNGFLSTNSLRLNA